MAALVVRIVALLPLAQAAGRRRELIWNPQFLIASLWLVGGLLLAAIVIALVNRWRRSSRAASLSASDQLAQYRLLYEQGEISEEEFERLRNLLGGRLRRAAGGQGTVSVAPPASSPSPEEAQPNRQPPPDNPPRPPEPPETGIRPG